MRTKHRPPAHRRTDESGRQLGLRQLCGGREQNPADDNIAPGAGNAFACDQPRQDLLRLVNSTSSSPRSTVAAKSR